MRSDVQALEASGSLQQQVDRGITMHSSPLKQPLVDFNTHLLALMVHLTLWRDEFQLSLDQTDLHFLAPWGGGLQHSNKVLYAAKGHCSLTVILVMWTTVLIKCIHEGTYDRSILTVDVYMKVFQMSLLFLQLLLCTKNKFLATSTSWHAWWRQVCVWMYSGRESPSLY